MERDTWPTGALRDVASALTDSLARDDWPNVLVVGTLLTLTAGHLLPALALVGYAVRVLRSGLTGTPRVPGFDDWAGLFREAVPATAVLLAYQAVPLAAAAVLVGTPGVGAVGGPPVAPSGRLPYPSGVLPAGPGGVPALAALGGTVRLLAAAVVVLVLAVVAGYLSLVGLTNYVRTGSVRAAFDPRALEREATRPQNGALWLACVGVAAVVAGLAAVLGAVPVVGRLLGATVAFYGLVATVGLWGRGVATASRRRSGESVEERSAADATRSQGRRSGNVD